MKDRFKFRGQTENGKWIYGSLLWYADEPQIWDKDGNNFIVKPETVGQCTCFKDKNGKLIFEGDIVEDILMNKFVVSLNKEYLLFLLTNIKTKGSIVFYPKIKIEVIGNQFENPELLEE